MSEEHGVVWPQILTGYTATLAALMVHLSSTERMPLSRIRHMQGQQLRLLVEHHASKTPSFAQRLKDAGVLPQSLTSVDSLKKLPPINKSYIQAQDTKFFCDAVPAAHQPVGKAQTSGSTGQPVTVMRSSVNNLMWEVMGLRDTQWHRRDFNLRFFSIRATIPDTQQHPSWGPPVSRLYKTAPSMGMNVSADIKEMLQKIQEFQPGILMLHAGILMEMTQHWEKHGFDLPCIKHVRNIGDTVTGELRQRFHAVSGLEIEDNYSSSETGAIAIQCPHSGLLHTCEEALIVEILHPDGTACSPGETGRVVVTDLHNFASPLIRYDLGDWAEVGRPCTCGRTLPTLKRIIGRERNIFIRPDGSRFWPRASMYDIPKIVQVRQWQMRQHTVDHVEYVLVTDEDPTQEQKDQITALIQKTLGWEPTVTITTRKQPLERAKNGKFEECISYVAR